MDIDKLSTCSKVMFDKRILEQRGEIERLRLENFWLKNGKWSLKMAMRNYNYENTRCACYACLHSGRADDDDDASSGFTGHGTYNCKFVTAFNRLLSKYSLTVTAEPGVCVDPMLPDDGYPGHPTCVDCNSHFENAGRCDWHMFAIGKKLWSAQRVDNTAVVNYENMLKELRKSSYD